MSNLYRYEKNEYFAGRIYVYLSDLYAFHTGTREE